MNHREYWAAEASKAPFILTPGESRLPYPPANGRCYDLDEMQKAVGGDIEVVRISGLWLIVDEEGKRKGCLRNDLATTLARNAGAIRADDFIVGDVLFCPPRMLK